MSDQIRFSQRVKNLARERKGGMIRMAWSGEFVEDGDAKGCAMSTEGPCTKAELDEFREIFSKWVNRKKAGQ